MHVQEKIKSNFWRDWMTAVPPSFDLKSCLLIFSVADKGSRVRAACIPALEWQRPFWGAAFISVARVIQLISFWSETESNKRRGRAQKPHYGLWRTWMKASPKVSVKRLWWNPLICGVPVLNPPRLALCGSPARFVKTGSHAKFTARRQKPQRRCKRRNELQWMLKLNEYKRLIILPQSGSERETRLILASARIRMEDGSVLSRRTGWWIREQITGQPHRKPTLCSKVHIHVKGKSYFSSQS